MIRFGLIGGGMAGPLSAGAIRDIPEAEITAFADIREDVCRHFARKYEIARWYTDYRELVKDQNVDAVCIAAPPFVHEEMAVMAAKAGKHVICEKPISVDLDSADRMITACKETDVRLGVIAMYRFMEPARVIRKALKENRLGRLISVDCSGKCFRSDAYYASGAWRGAWKGEGGGSLISQTIHFIDLMLYFAGDVESLYGRYMTSVHPDIEVDDAANATFRFKNGAIGTVLSATAVRPGYPRHIELHGEKGTIKIVEEEIVEWKVDGMKEEDYLTKTKVDSGDTATGAGYVATENHRLQFLDFIDAVKNHRAPLVDGNAGRKTLEFIRAVYQSGDTGQPVTFPIKENPAYGRRIAHEGFQ